MMDWQVGDLAVCVDDLPDRGCPSSVLPIKRGQVYRVSGLDLIPDCYGEIGLELDGVELTPQRSANFDWEPSFRSSRFRKIRPDEHEACEPEFVTLLQRTKVGADA